MNAFTHDDHERALRALGRAPFEPESWDEALQLFAKAGGGWAAQLLGVTDTGGVELHAASGLTPDALAEFERLGGGVPDLNPRARPALWQPVGGVVCDDDYIDAQGRDRSPFYQGLFRKYDADFVLGGRGANLGHVRVAITAVRTAGQGHAQGVDRERIAALLAPFSRALELQSALNLRGMNLAASSLDALSIAAFLCDAWGQVVALTENAERLAAAGEVVALRRRRLAAVDARADEQLQGALRRICRATAWISPPHPQVVVAPDAQGSARRIDIAPVLTAPIFIRSSVVAIVAVGGATGMPSPPVLQAAFGLTAAEAEVAVEVASGRTAAEIAARRGVSPATVRVQVQAVMQKAGVHKAAELATLVSRLAPRGI